MSTVRSDARRALGTWGHAKGNMLAMPQPSPVVCVPLPRVHALYYTDKVCCEPLTPTFHLSDMRSSVRGYTEQVARALKAVVLAMWQMQKVYTPFMLEEDAAAYVGNSRDPRLSAGLPYMLREARQV